MKGELPPLPPSPATPRKFDQQATVRHAPVDNSTSRFSKGTVQREPSDEYDDYDDDQFAETYPDEVEAIQNNLDRVHLDETIPDTTMLDSVILPAIASLFPRVSTQEARVALSALQRAFTEAERIIPGVTMELVNEIVDSVEHVEDDRDP